ncbi:hypothetical protein TIFTF001_021327 [Ficus carica]|uniref:Uncharacterized protein n=1 Tax=Ficus carica TaxID=3494 RepID=A0AA88AH98_FICCA|nr:hypothetical protein TIFTF001_021327 [Ficus carica]
MASDESMTVRSCISMQLEPEDEFDHDDDTMEGGDYYQAHHKYFSRLSVCNTSTSPHDDVQPPAATNLNFYDEHRHPTADAAMYHMMSGLSLQSFEADADADADDDSSDAFKPTTKRLHHPHTLGLLVTSDSDQDSGAVCHSLPATPPSLRPRNHRRTADHGKEYNEEAAAAAAAAAAADRSRRRKWRRRSRRMISRDGEFWKKFHEEERVVIGGDDDDDGDVHDNNTNYNKNCTSTGGESQSESSSVTAPAVMITRPKGGKRSLRMDLDEVKACRELGFELETPLPLPLPLHTVSNLSADTTSTTSGGNSPVHWRISSPGDNPRDVKARLKVWAQAVALASTSRHASWTL